MELSRLLPDYYEKNVTMRTLQEILSAETGTLEAELSQIIRECFVPTASRMLTRYEKLSGVKPDYSLPDVFRRERIQAKIAGASASTVKMITETAAAYSDGEIEITEDIAGYRFVIRFVGEKGVPANISSLMSTIEDIKPAHLAVEYAYTYNRWENLAAFTWEQMAVHTWEEVRTVRLSE